VITKKSSKSENVILLQFFVDLYVVKLLAVLCFLVDLPRMSSTNSLLDYPPRMSSLNVLLECGVLHVPVDFALRVVEAFQAALALGAATAFSAFRVLTADARDAGHAILEARRTLVVTVVSLVDSNC